MNDAATTEHDMRDATQATIEHTDDIREYLDIIRAELDKMNDETDSPSWSHVGSLAHMSHELREIVAFVRNEER
jgi:hypothetical protein